MDGIKRGLGQVVAKSKELLTGPQISDEADEGGDAKKPKQAMLEISQQQMAALALSRRSAESWVKGFGVTMGQIADAAENLKGVPPDPKSAHYEVPSSVWNKWVAAQKQWRAAFAKMKEHVAMNTRILLPSAAQAAAREAELHEQNEALAASASEAEQAAAEAASKLQATQTALHQSSAGHSNIGSAFPLSLEIAEKIKTFGKSDGHTALVLEHLLDKFKTTEALSAAMGDLHAYCRDTVHWTFTNREKIILEALSPVERTPFIDGYVRRLWQEYHADFLPTQDISQVLQGFLSGAGAPRQSSPVWQKVYHADDAPAACIAHVMKDLLQLYIFTTVCDPPMTFDPKTMGKQIPFNSDTAAPLDDKIKAGKPCFVLCPALYGADGLLKAKAVVLAADYL